MPLQRESLPTSAEVGYVLPGGGVRGAVQAGMLLELDKHGVSPSCIIGVSVGSINAAGYVAGIAEEMPLPAHHVLDMWCEEIRSPEDIAHVPVTIQEVLTVVYAVYKALVNPEEDLGRFPRFRSVLHRLRRDVQWGAFWRYALRHPVAACRTARKVVRTFFTHIYESGGLLDPRPIYGVIDKIDFTAIQRIADTIELVVVVTDEETGDPVYFSSREHPPAIMEKAVRASIGLPPQLPPVSIEGHLYGDGGIADLLPVRYALDRGCDTIHVLTTHPKDGPLVNIELYEEIPFLSSILSFLRTLRYNAFSTVAHYRRERRWWSSRPDVVWHEVDAFPATVTSTLRFQDEHDITTMIDYGRRATRTVLQEASQ